MKIKLYQCGGEVPLSEYPLGLGYLKTNCESPDIQIDIVKNKIELKDCDYIGLSANAWGIKEAIEILNSTDIPIVLGGQGTLWQQVHNYSFKHIVIGEGETAFKRILNKECIKKVIKEDLIENIDILKFPERGMCKTEEIPILTSRGCPFSCSFCSSRVFWGKVRFHSAEYFIDEIEYLLKRYPHIKVLYIMDDLFIAHKKRLEQIYKIWMSKGLNKRLQLRGFIRSDIFDIQTGTIMKDMGFKRVRFGAESGSNKVLNFIGKGTTVEKHENTIKIAKQLGLQVSASFMTDIPGETEEDKKITLNFINKWKGILIVEGFYKFKAFPGTEFYSGEDITKCDMRVR